MVLPTSTCASVYVDLVALSMLAQPEPLVSQRRHWAVYLIGVLPVNVPGVSVSVDPRLAEPVMAGGEVLLGAALVAAEPLLVDPMTAPAEMTTSASRRDVVRLLENKRECIGASLKRRADRERDPRGNAATRLLRPMKRVPTRTHLWEDGRPGRESRKAQPSFRRDRLLTALTTA
jgi:hypothetical protein